MSDRRTGSMTFEPETQAAAPKRFWTRKKIVAGIVAAAVAIPGAAYAAAFLYGFGDVNVETPATNGLIVLDSTDGNYATQITPALVPGGSAGVKVPVRNTSPYTVNVVGLIVKNNPSYTPSGTACAITVNGDSVGYPTDAGGTSGLGKLTNLVSTQQVSLAPGAEATIDVPNVFTQASTATALCGISASFAVKGQVGS